MLLYRPRAIRPVRNARANRRLSRFLLTQAACAWLDSCLNVKCTRYRALLQMLLKELNIFSFHTLLLLEDRLAQNQKAC